MFLICIGMIPCPANELQTQAKHIKKGSSHGHWISGSIAVLSRLELHISYLLVKFKYISFLYECQWAGWGKSDDLPIDKDILTT
jgi:hypothetical protein